MPLKALDLFSGAGGLSLGLALAGFEIVGAVEIDKHACQSYKHNLGEHVFEKDIREFPPDELERELIDIGCIKSKDEIDFIAGGPPCPGFSNIGRSKISSLMKSGKWKGSDARHGYIDDPRNKLFHEFVKYVDYFQPSYFLMENVGGIISYSNIDNTPIVEVIKKEFFNIGYTVDCKLLLASNFGVPQNRKRVFFIGTINGKTPPDITNEESKGKINAWEAICDLPDAWIGPVSNDEKCKALSKLESPKKSNAYKFLKKMRTIKMPTKHSAKNDSISQHRMRPVNPRDVGIFPCIKSGEFGKKVIFADLDPSTISFPSPWKWNKSRGVVYNRPEKKEYKWYDPGPFADKMRRIRGDKPSPTILAHLTHDGYMFIHPHLDRTITVREAARLQSFPDSFDFSAGGKVPWSKQFRQVGNAVPPLLGMAIGEKFFQVME